jgi:hypothetical protein
MAHAELDLVLRSIVLMLLTVLVMSLFLKKLNQPYFVAYIIAGFYWALKAFNDHETIVVMGELGLINLFKRRQHQPAGAGLPLVSFSWPAEVSNWSLYAIDPSIFFHA